MEGGQKILLSKWMPLWYLPEFPQGRDNPLLRLKHGEVLEKAGQLLHPTEGRWLTPAEIKTKWSLPDLNFLAISKLSTFCHSETDSPN